MSVAIPLGGDGGFGQGDDGIERGWIGDGDFREALAIELDLGLRDAVDEFAVANTPFAAGSVDADDPQLAELTLACAAIAEGEGFGPGDVFLGRAYEVTACADVTFGLLEKTVLAALTRHRVCSTH